MSTDTLSTSGGGDAMRGGSRAAVAIVALSLVRCGQSASSPDLAPGAEPEPAPVSAAVEHDRLLRFGGVCDSSAAVLNGAGQLVLASDEDNTLRLVDVNGGETSPLRPSLVSLIREIAPEFELEIDGGRPREIDIEGVAAIGDGAGRMAFWIGSHANRKARIKNHGRVRNPRRRPNRRLFFATSVPPSANSPLTLRAKPRRNLLEPLRDPNHKLSAELQPIREVADTHSYPNAGGINIEGLAATADGKLVIGFRAPPGADQRALVVRLDNPLDVIDHGASPVYGAVQWLDLGTRGIRSIARWPGQNSWLIVAGPVDYLDISDSSLPQEPGFARDFRLYAWSGFGAEARELEIDIAEGLRPEVLVLSGSAALLVSDDGGVFRGTTACKNLPAGDPNRFSRGLRIEIDSSR